MGLYDFIWFNCGRFREGDGMMVTQCVIIMRFHAIGSYLEALIMALL